MGKNAKVPPVAGGRILACSIAALLVSSAIAKAEEASWIAPGSGNWSVPQNWLGEAVPTSDPNLVLVFQSGGSGTVTSTNDLPGQFTFGELRLASEEADSFIISGNALRFTGAASRIVQNGAGNVRLFVPLELAIPGGGMLRVEGNGIGKLSVGTIAESGGPVSMVIARPSTSLHTSLTELNATGTTGGIVLESGNLTLFSTAFPSTTAPLIVKGGSVRFGSTSAIFSNPIQLHSDLLLVSGNRVTLGQITSAVPGTGLTLRMSAPSFETNPQPRLVLNQASSYTGPTRIDYDPTFVGELKEAGTLFLSGNGALSSTSLIDIRAGGHLALGTVDAGGVNRLPDVAPIELRSGRLTTYGGSLGSPQVEKVGTIRVGGHSIITVAPSSIPTETAHLSAASLERLGQGTLLLRGIPTGASPVAANARGRVLLGLEPSLIGGGGGTGIVSYAIGDPSPTGTGTGLVSYSPGIGLRLLQPEEYVPNFNTPNANVRLTSATVAPSSQTINALVLAGGNITGAGNITVASGLVLNVGSSRISANLNFASRDGKIITNTNLSADGIISGTQGLTKAGNGTLTLTRSNTFSGPLAINGGMVSFSSPAQLGTGNSPIVIAGQQTGLFSTGQNVVLNRPIVLDSGTARIETETGTRTLALGGVISGQGGMYIDSGTRATVRLTGSNTFTGPVQLRLGTVEFTSQGLGNGSDLTVEAGTLRLLDNWTTDRTIRIIGSAWGGLQVDTGGYDAQWNGAAIGGGTLTKTGTGSLTLNASSALTGTIVVEGGTLAFAKNAMLMAREIQLRGGARLLSDHSALPLASRLHSEAVVTLDSGQFAISGHAGQVSRESVGQLTSSASSQFKGLTLSPGIGVGSGVIMTSGSLDLAGRSLYLNAGNLGGDGSQPFSRITFQQEGFLRSGIAPGIYLQSAASGAEMLLTYDRAIDSHGAIGLKAATLNSTNVIQNPANGGETPVGMNLLVSGGVTTALGVQNAINSATMMAGGTLSLSPGQTLNIRSGTVLRRSDTDSAAITGGVLDFGLTSPVFGVFSDLEVTSSIRNTAPFIKHGVGTLTLAGEFTSAGRITVAEGALRAGSEITLAHQTVQLDRGTGVDFRGTVGPASLGGVEGIGTLTFGSSRLTLGLAGSDMTFSGSISGTGELVIVDGGRSGAIRAFSGAQGFAGNVVLQSGELSLLTNDALGSGSLTAAGGTLRVPPTGLTLKNQIILNADLVINGEMPSFGDPVPLTLSPTATISGSHSLIVRSPSGVILQSAAAHAGETRLESVVLPNFSKAPGLFHLSSAEGALTNSSAIWIGQGRTLRLEGQASYTGGAAGRLPDDSAVYLDGGEITGGTSERIGALHGRGYNLIRTWSEIAGRLTAASLVRDARGTFYFGDPPVIPDPLPGGIFIDSPPLADFFGGGGTGPQTSILPYAIGRDESAPGNLADFVTYDLTQGIRKLNPATDYAQSLESATATSNVRLATATVLNDAATVNSLHLTADLTGSGSLKVASGAILFANSNARVFSNLDFGDAEGHFFVPVSGLVTGTIAGDAGLTVSGKGTLFLSGANTFTGPLTLNGGMIKFSSLASLGSGDSPIGLSSDIPGQGLCYTGFTPLEITRDIELVGGLGGLGNTNGGYTALQFSGVISGDGALSTKDVTLSGTNTYTGGTVVQGDLGINSDSALGAAGGTVIFHGGGRLHLSGPWDTSRKLMINTNRQVALNGHDVVLRGELEGSATLAFIPMPFIQPGSVTLTADSRFTGEVTGSFTLAGAGAVKSASVGTVTLDNREIPSSDRLLDTAVINGATTLIGNSETLVRERVGRAGGITLVSAGNAPTILEALSYEAKLGEEFRTIRGDRLGGAEAGFTRFALHPQPSFPGNLLPFSLAADRSGAFPQSFAYYDVSADEYGPIGARALRDADYFSTAVLRNSAHGGTTPMDANVLIGAEVQLGATTVSVNSLTMRENGALELSAGQTLSVANGAVLVQAGTSGVIDGGRLDLGESSRFLISGTLDLRSSFSTQFLGKHGPGTLRVGDIDAAGIAVYEGQLVLNGDVAPGGMPSPRVMYVYADASLSGSGTIERELGMLGKISPGEQGTGLIRSFGLSLEAGSTLDLDLHSPSDYDCLDIAGRVTLGAPISLKLALAYDPVDFVDAFTVISNDGSDPVLRPFGWFYFGGQRLEERAEFLAGGQYFQISYAGGDGNDVVLRAVPEPSASLLLLSGIASLTGRRRRVGSDRCIGG